MPITAPVAYEIGLSPRTRLAPAGEAGSRGRLGTAVSDPGAYQCARPNLLISPSSGGGRWVNDLRTGGLLLYGRHIGGLTTSIGTPHTVFDAASNRTTALFFKLKAGADVALAGLFALLAGFVSESLCVRQVVLGRSSVPILVIKVLNWSVVIVVILRQCSLHRNQ